MQFAFSPDGTILATSHAEFGLSLWDAATGKPLAPRADPPGQLSELPPGYP